MRLKNITKHELFSLFSTLTQIKKQIAREFSYSLFHLFPVTFFGNFHEIKILRCAWRIAGCTWKPFRESWLFIFIFIFTFKSKSQWKSNFQRYLHLVGCQVKGFSLVSFICLLQCKMLKCKNIEKICCYSDRLECSQLKLMEKKEERWEEEIERVLKILIECLSLFLAA